ncbi:MAG: HEAT repeat domain-containing protein [Methanolinea sp.]|nr:HEAT repeat domain-containing protein [Methanolinea sp.]
MIPDLLWEGKPPDIRALAERKDFHRLVLALRHRDLEIQWQATEALGELGKEGLDYLLQALKSRNRDIRLGIIEALGEIGDVRAIPHLVLQLKDRSNEIRWETALALGEFRDPSVIPPLCSALRDEDHYVRYGAALSLQKISWKSEDPTEFAFFMTGLQRWDDLSSLGEHALPAITNALRDPDRNVRVPAVRCLGRIGSERAIPALFKALRDPDEEVRWEAVLAGPRCGIPMQYLPRGLSRRPRVRKNPLVAGFLNFILPGMGYLYLGMWWGVILFQIDVYATLWIFVNQEELFAYSFLWPIYLILGLHAGYIAMRMPDL